MFLPASQKTLRKNTDNPFQKSHLCRFCPHLKKRSEKLLTIHFKGLIFVGFASISKKAQKNYWQSISKVSSLSFLPASQKTLRKITDNPFQRSHLCRFCPYLKKRSEKLLIINFKSLIFVVFARISKNAQKNYWQSISKVSFCRFCPHLKKRSEKLLTIHFKGLIYVVFARISKNNEKNYWQSNSKVSSLSFLPASRKTLRKNTDNPFQKSHLCGFRPHLKKRSEKLLTIHFKGLIFVVFACISKKAQKNYWQSISKVSSLSFLPASQKTLRKITDNPFQKSHLCRFCPHLKKRSEKLLTIHFKSLIFVVFARISKNNEKNYRQSNSNVSSLSFLPASQKTLRKITDNPFQKSHLCGFCPHLKKRSEKLLTIHFKSLISSFLPASQKTLRKITDNPFQRSYLCRSCPHLKKRSEKLLTIHFKGLIFVVFARIWKNNEKNYWQSNSKVSSLSFLPASQKTLRKITDNPFQKSHLCRFCPRLKKRSEKLLTIHFKSLIFVVFARISKNNEKNYRQSISNVSSLSFLPASQKTLRKNTDNPFQKSHLCGFCPHLKKRSEKLLTIHFKSLISSFLPASQKTLRKITDNPFQRSYLCRSCPHLKKRSEKLLTIHFKGLIFVVFARISKNNEKNYKKRQSISKVSSLSFLPASQKTLRKNTDNRFQKIKKRWQSHLCGFCPHLKKRSEKLLTIHFKSLICRFCPHLKKRSEKLLTIHFKGLTIHFVVFARISKNAQKNYWQSISKVSSLCPHLKKQWEKLLTIHFRLIFVVFARISKNAEKNYWQSISMRKITDFSLIFVVFARISKNAHWQSISKVSFCRFCPHLKKRSYWQSISKVSPLSFLPAMRKITDNPFQRSHLCGFRPHLKKRKITDNPFQKSHLCGFRPHLKKRSDKLLTIHFKSLIFVIFARISKNAQKNYWQSISKFLSLSFLPASQKTMRKITDNPFQTSHLCRFCPHLKKRWEKLLTIHFKSLIFVVFARISKNAQKSYWQSISKVSSFSFLPASQKTLRKITDNPFQKSHFVVFARISKNAQKKYWQSISKVSPLSFLPASQKTMRKITDNPFQRSHLCGFRPHLKKRQEKLLTIHFKSLIFVVFARNSKNAQKNYWQSILKVSFRRFCPHLKKRSEKLLTILFKGLIFVVFARISKNAQKNYWQSISKVSSLSFLHASQKTLRKITDNPFQRSHLCRFRPHLKKQWEKLMTIHFKGLIFVIFVRISKNKEKNYWQSISNVSSLSFLPASQKTPRKITDNPFQKSHLCGFCRQFKKRSEKLLTIHFKSLTSSFLPASQKTLRKITDNLFQRSHLCRFCPHLKKRSEKLLTIHFKGLIFVVFARISKNAQKNYWQSISKVSSLSFSPASEKTMRKITDNPFQRSHLCRFCPHLKKRSEKLLTIDFKSLIFVVFARISKNAQKNYWQSISKVSSLSFLPASQKTIRKITDNPFQRSHLCRFCPHLKKQWENLLTIHFKGLIFVVFARISKNAQKNYWQSISKVSSLWFSPASQKTLTQTTDNPFQKSHLCHFCPHLKKRSEKLLTILFKGLIFVVFARIWKNNEKN